MLEEHPDPRYQHVADPDTREFLERDPELWQRALPRLGPAMRFGGVAWWVRPETDLQLRALLDELMRVLQLVLAGRHADRLVVRELVKDADLRWRLDLTQRAPVLDPRRLERMWKPRHPEVMVSGGDDPPAAVRLTPFEQKFTKKQRERYAGRMWPEGSYRAGQWWIVFPWSNAESVAFSIAVAIAVAAVSDGVITDDRRDLTEETVQTPQALIGQLAITAEEARFSGPVNALLAKTRGLAPPER
jgi:hypothetical protein